MPKIISKYVQKIGPRIRLEEINKKEKEVFRKNYKFISLEKCVNEILNNQHIRSHSLQ